MADVIISKYVAELDAQLTTRSESIEQTVAKANVEKLTQFCCGVERRNTVDHHGRHHYFQIGIRC